MSSLRVLVVSSDRAMVARIRRLLRPLGHSVAGVGASVAAHAEQDGVDVAIDDTREPHSAPGSVAELPTVYLVPIGQDALIEQLLEAGAHAVAPMPLTG